MQTETTAIVPSPRRTAPGPKPWPLLGNLGALRGLLPFLEKEWKAHGDLFRVHILGLNAVIVAHPDLIQRVLVSNRQNYVKGDVYKNLRRVLGEGSLTLEGDAWKQRRSLVQPSFHRASLEKLTAIMVESGAQFFDKLASAGPSVVDSHQTMVRLTLDVVINALFGRGTLASSSVSYDALNELLELVSNAANGVQLPDWVPTPRNIRFRRTLRSLYGNVDEVVRAGRGRENDGTLLAMLLEARDEDGNPLSSEALRAEVLTLFIAGHETTALTMTWMLSLLADHPHVLGRMREEVDGVLGGREPTFADVNKLVYLRQVIEETLRLRPPGAMVGRNAAADDELGGYAVHGGDVVLPYIWGAHRHPDFWTQPGEFDPERFAPAKAKGRHLASYLPFSIGPRICVGNMFSLIETQILVAQLLARFDLELDSCLDVKPVALGTVRPSRPIALKLKPRRRS